MIFQVKAPWFSELSQASIANSQVTRYYHPCRDSSPIIFWDCICCPNGFWSGSWYSNFCGLNHRWVQWSIWFPQSFPISFQETANILQLIIQESTNRHLALSRYFFFLADVTLHCGCGTWCAFFGGLQQPDCSYNIYWTCIVFDDCTCSAFLWLNTYSIRFCLVFFHVSL